jgi:hypothetical protein
VTTCCCGAASTRAARRRPLHIRDLKPRGSTSSRSIKSTGKVTRRHHRLHHGHEGGRLPHRVARRILRARDHGATQDYVKAMKAEAKSARRWTSRAHAITASRRATSRHEAGRWQRDGRRSGACEDRITPELSRDQRWTESLDARAASACATACAPTSSEMKAAGYDKLTAEEPIRVRDHGSRRTTSATSSQGIKNVLTRIRPHERLRRRRLHADMKSWAGDLASQIVAPRSRHYARLRESRARARLQDDRSGGARPPEERRPLEGPLVQIEGTPTRTVEPK